VFSSTLLSVALLVVHAHPSAERISVAGPGPIEVCYEMPVPGGVTSPGPSSSWGCTEYEGRGAWRPITLTLPIPGPVRVSGARWAYVEQDGLWVPMQAFQTQYPEAAPK